MSTDPAWRPEVVRGAGRDSRLERRRAEMSTLWAEGLAALGRGDASEADELFDEANDLGMSLPTVESRVCVLTGGPALGYARVPGTDWGADVAISHGRDETRPTALDRWVGWVDGAGQDRGPVRPSGVVVARGDVPMLRLAPPKGSPAFGLAGVLHRLGVAEGDWVEADVARDGSVVLCRAAPGGGPRPVED
jgi:hypothetical protein